MQCQSCLVFYSITHAHTHTFTILHVDDTKCADDETVLRVMPRVLHFYVLETYKNWARKQTHEDLLVHALTHRCRGSHLYFRCLVLSISKCSTIHAYISWYPLKYILVFLSATSP
jgi:hypothetical protein